MKVYVAVNLDLGWDNVLGVYDTHEKAIARCRPTDEDLAEDAEKYLKRLGDRNDPKSIFSMHHIHCKEVE